MFDSLNELEKEVQEFRKNILASSDLIRSFEKLAKEVSTQSQTVDNAARSIVKGLEQQKRDLQQHSDETLTIQVNRLIESNECVVSEFQTQTRRLVDSNNVLAQDIKQVASKSEAHVAGLLSEHAKEIHGYSAEMLEGIKQQTVEIQSSTGELASRIEKQAEDAKASFNTTLAQNTECLMKACENIQKQADKKIAAIDAAAKEYSDKLEKQIYDQNVQAERVLSTQVETLNRESAAQIDKAVSQIISANNAFVNSARDVTYALELTRNEMKEQYQLVIDKLEDANLEEAVRLSNEIIRSVRNKFVFLMSGVGIAIILGIIALIK